MGGFWGPSFCWRGVGPGVGLGLSFASVPPAFRVASRHPADPERETRIACRDAFRSTRLLEKIIPLIDDVLAAGGLALPETPKGAIPPAIIEEDPWDL